MPPTTYKIPKKRTTVKTINMNNGTLTYDVDDSGRGYWFRNGKYITPSQLKSYRYYDKDIKGYRSLDERPTIISAKHNEPIIYGASTPVRTPSIDYLLDKNDDTRIQAEKTLRKQTFKANNKFITLRTKGRMNLATVPTNVLDSIAINAGRAGTDIKTGLGLVGKESTFGRWSVPLGNDPRDKYYDLYDLTNNHAYFTNPYHEYYNAIGRKFKGYTYDDAVKVKAEEDAKYALDHGLVIDKTPHYNWNITADAFERYANNPSGYNPGQGNYVHMVNAIGNEVLGDKAIQQWYQGEGINYYNKGLNERRRLETRGNKSK